MNHSMIKTNHTSNIFNGPTLIWCLLMPLIHFLSLLSNIFCIIIFCSKTFIHKPIAIYFICLLISDSTTLLIGYSEMLDRESNMINRSSLLCMFNENIIHKLTDSVYSFMGRYCLEWMLYKVLWTRASTILLAILSVQRSRTFFSLSYRETRYCAVVACITSVLIALLITCFEWIGVQCAKSTDPYIYMDVFQLVVNNKLAKEFYISYFTDHFNETIDKYYCVFQSLNNIRINSTISIINQLNCSISQCSSEFYLLTQSLITNRDTLISDSMTNLLSTIYDSNTSITNMSILYEKIENRITSDVFIKLFENRSCQITLMHSIYFKIFNFLNSLAFTFNRHTIAIFFGNALPSFIVFLANLFSLKVIYFSTNLKYLKHNKRKYHHKSRLKNDIRALLVILIESFSIITISWGIPIFLTMYHCHTLYVVSIAVCPQIKHTLALFLFTDLFNSSTNCLLYSLSGKLFRRKFISIIKIIFTCGRGISWNVRTPPINSPSQQMELQVSNEPSVTVNYMFSSKSASNPTSTPISSRKSIRLKRFSKKSKLLDNNASITVTKVDDEQNIDDVEFVKQIHSTDKFRGRQTIKTILIDKVHWFGRTRSQETRQTKSNIIYRQRARIMN